MKDIAASIDLGSHTARLLIARRSTSSPWGWEPLLRRRAYTRLAADSRHEVEREIGPTGVARAVEALNDFSRLLADYNVGQVRAVATGIIRDATHGDRFLAHLREQTGISIALISGEREALLSGRGACNVLNIRGESVVFDLGGGTTEFLWSIRGGTRGMSLPLGAAVLTQKFIRSDPPAVHELDGISREVEQGLSSVASDIAGPSLVVGTGGTVATLGALIHGIAADDITPERLNGRVLTLSQIEACVAQMKSLTSAERVARLGIDWGRADVIAAGSLVVLGILRFLGKSDLLVSISDLLEGLLIED